MTNLLHARCQSEVPRSMDTAAIRQHLTEVGGWTQHDAAIQKTFLFRSYHETIAFVNALAWVCHTENHHPDLHVTYDHCVVRFSTHSVSGISRNDFICAARADALVSFVA